MPTRVLEVDGVALVSFSPAQQEQPTAERVVALADLDVAVPAIMEHLAGHWLTSDDDELLDALLSAGATLVRYSHTYRRRLDRSALGTGGGRSPDRWRVTPIDRSVIEMAQLSRRTYAPGHVDYEDVPESETAEVLEALLSGVLVGEFLGDASAQVVDGDALVGLCIVNRATGPSPEGGPWITEVFRDPDPTYAGVGRRLLVNAIDVLTERGEATLGLAVTDANPARRTYEALGFEWVVARRKLGIPGRVEVDGTIVRPSGGGGPT